MKTNFNFKQKYNTADLVEILKILRSPEGCMWDREQTHQSIRKDFIEETYEVIEAIDRADSELLCEELGDVLLQIVFHAQLETEAGRFTYDDVADGICKKMIERHPHVFGETAVSSTEEVLANWEKIKSQTKNRKTAAEKMQAVPRQLPALMRAEKLQKRAAKVGFDWDTPEGALQKLPEEQAELLAAIAAGDAENTAEELGDLLFSIVNVARKLHIDPEEALIAASDKFQKRFTAVEQLAAQRGLEMEKQPLSVLDELWDTVKAEQKQES